MHSFQEGFSILALLSRPEKRDRERETSYPLPIKRRERTGPEEGNVERNPLSPLRLDWKTKTERERERERERPIVREDLVGKKGHDKPRVCIGTSVCYVGRKTLEPVKQQNWLGIEIKRNTRGGVAPGVKQGKPAKKGQGKRRENATGSQRD